MSICPRECLNRWPISYIRRHRIVYVILVLPDRFPSACRYVTLRYVTNSLVFSRLGRKQKGLSSLKLEIVAHYKVFNNAERENAWRQLLKYTRLRAAGETDRRATYNRGRSTTSRYRVYRFHPRCRQRGIIELLPFPPFPCSCVRCPFEFARRNDGNATVREKERKRESEKEWEGGGGSRREKR